MANYQRIARQKAQKYGLDPRIFVRQIRQESGFNPNAVSPAGATGIAQIMPATARGWGVNPRDPVASLDAAAKNMAAYVRKYGSYRNALVAYNAGPGRVGGSLPTETQNYIRNILGGRDPGRLNAPSAQSARTPFTPARVELGQKNVFDQAGFDQAKKAALVGGLIARRHGTGGILFRTGLLTTAQPNQSDFMSSTMTSKLIPGRAGQAGHVVTKPRGGGVHIRGPLFELFWQGAKGIDVKNGQIQPQGFVSGHTDHVHVAAGRTTIVELGKIARRLGLHVGENPHFGGVHPVHVEGSYHYRNQAIDVSGDAGAMAAYAHRVARLFGVGR